MGLYGVNKLQRKLIQHCEVALPGGQDRIYQYGISRFFKSEEICVGARQRFKMLAKDHRPSDLSIRVQRAQVQPLSTRFMSACCSFVITPSA